MFFLLTALFALLMGIVACDLAQTPRKIAHAVLISVVFAIIAIFGLFMNEPLVAFAAVGWILGTLAAWVSVELSG